MKSLIVLPDTDSTVSAWLQAVSELRKNSGHCYNLVYVVSKPNRFMPNDIEVIREFDQYALQSGLHSVETVANTIFPLDTYRSQPSDGFYDYYLADVFPRVKKQWGTYFERMISRKNADGSLMEIAGKQFNPLEAIILKAKKRVKTSRGSKTHFELSLDDPALDFPTFQPELDTRYQVGGPCLSHLSFKIDSDGALRLTAFYRSHWYIARALGNLVGLARLQSFVAASAGISSGPLTIIASEATLDVSGHLGGAGATTAMIGRCNGIALRK